MTNKAREIYNFIASRGGRAASISPEATLPEGELKVTEMVNGVLVTRPLKKVTEFSETQNTQTGSESEPIAIDLQEKYGKSKAASTITVPVNKMKEIFDFYFSRGRY